MSTPLDHRDGPRDECGVFGIYAPDVPGMEVARIAYAEDDMPIETVINVFPSQQWRLSYEWPAG